MGSGCSGALEMALTGLLNPGMLIKWQQLYKNLYGY